MCSNTSYTSNMDVGCRQRGFAATNHDITLSLGPHLTAMLQNWNWAPHLDIMCNSLRVHPYAHPPRIKVLKHFIYIQYGCGMQSVVVPSLNHGSTISFGSILLLHFSKKSPPPPAQVLQCKGAPICPSTDHEGAQTLHIPPIWMWDAVWDLLQPQP